MRAMKEQALVSKRNELRNQYLKAITSAGSLEEVIELEQWFQDSLKAINTTVLDLY